MLRQGGLVRADAPTQNADPDLPSTGPIFACGTYALAQVARARGWIPGAFEAGLLDFDACNAGWGEAMLNHDAQAYPRRALPTPTAPAFVRPHADSKAFSGQLLTPAQLAAWQAERLANRYHVDFHHRHLPAKAQEVNTAGHGGLGPELRSQTAFPSGTSSGQCPGSSARPLNQSSKIGQGRQPDGRQARGARAGRLAFGLTDFTWGAHPSASASPIH